MLHGYSQSFLRSLESVSKVSHRSLGNSQDFPRIPEHSRSFKDISQMTGSNDYQGLPWEFEGSYRNYLKLSIDIGMPKRIERVPKVSQTGFFGVCKCYQNSEKACNGLFWQRFWNLAGVPKRFRGNPRVFYSSSWESLGSSKWFLRGVQWILQGSNNHNGVPECHHGVFRVLFVFSIHFQRFSKVPNMFSALFSVDSRDFRGIPNSF